MQHMMWQTWSDLISCINCRRCGKPTSLGCFDHEEQAARAYDKMMLWCELHNSSGVKGGITNFDPAEYEKDLSWLQVVNQVSSSQLCQTLRKAHKLQSCTCSALLLHDCTRSRHAVHDCWDPGYSCASCLALCRTNW